MCAHRMHTNTHTSCLMNVWVYTQHTELFLKCLLDQLYRFSRSPYFLSLNETHTNTHTGEWISGSVCMYVTNYLINNYTRVDKVRNKQKHTSSHTNICTRHTCIHAAYTYIHAQSHDRHVLWYVYMCLYSVRKAFSPLTRWRIYLTPWNLW